MNGFVFIDKPKGITSFDLVRKVRKISGEKKVGHSGTLDPLATGLMILALGEGTKLLEYMIGHDKEYEALACFGYRSDTYDAEGDIVKVDTEKVVDDKDILKAIEKHFLGKIEQIPPKYSALKINGKKACERVRSGENVEMKKRIIDVYGFDVIEDEWPLVRFRIECGAGTYVRSLINDLGKILGCGAYVKELMRTKIDRFCVEESCDLNELSNNFEQKIVSMEVVAQSFPFIELKNDEYEGLKDGRVLRGKKVEQGKMYMAFYKGKLVGILEDFKDSGVKYKKVIH